MAMVGVVSGSLYRRTHSLSRLAWSCVGGRLAPFYIHQMNRVNSRNGCAMMYSTINIVVLIIIIIIISGRFVSTQWIINAHRHWQWALGSYDTSPAIANADRRICSYTGRYSSIM